MPPARTGRPSPHARRRPTRPAAVVAGAVLAGLVLTSCGGGAAEELRSDVAREVVGVDRAAAVPEAVAATDRLGLELLAGEAANAVVSPASAVVALAMVAEGARGTTAAELDELLGAAGEERSAAYNALTAQLEPLAGDPGVVQDDQLPETPVVHLANNVVLDDQVVVHEAYLERLATSFDAGAQTVDLGSGEGKEALDAWVREHTGGLIEQSAMQPDPDLRLVLQNAVVVAAAWAMPFDPADPLAFTLADGVAAKVPAMRTVLYGAPYAEEAGWQAVRLGYTGGALYADVLVPPPGDAPTELTAATLAELTSRLTALGEGSTEVHLTMPTVDLRTRTDLLPVLQQYVPSLAVPGEADLSGISDEVLALTQAEQQATLAIDEAGTVAAAVTELGFGAGAPAEPPELVELVVDRPFLFRIGEAQTDWTLFLARIGDPRTP